MCPKPPHAWAAGRAAAAARAADDSFIAGVGEYTALSRCLVQAPVSSRVVMLRRDTARNDSKGTPKIPKRWMNVRQKVSKHSRHRQPQKSLAVNGEKGGRPQSHWPASSTPPSLEASCWGDHSTAASESSNQGLEVAPRVACRRLSRELALSWAYRVSGCRAHERRRSDAGRRGGSRVPTSLPTPAGSAAASPVRLSLVLWCPPCTEGLW